MLLALCPFLILTGCGSDEATLIDEAEGPVDAAITETLPETTYEEIENPIEEKTEEVTQET